MMHCPECDHGRTLVTDSRPAAHNGIRRRRRCLKCNHAWTTYEIHAPPVALAKGIVSIADEAEALRKLIAGMVEP
jgi:transcriptional repressor NrdR